MLGATTALFCYLEATMLAPQWLDAGVFLQSVMLLLQAEGVDTCPQIAWAEYHRTVAEVLGPPPGLTLVCGMSIPTNPDPAVPGTELPRAELSDVVTFLS